MRYDPTVFDSRPWAPAKYAPGGRSTENIYVGSARYNLHLASVYDEVFNREVRSKHDLRTLERLKARLERSADRLERVQGSTATRDFAKAWILQAAEHIRSVLATPDRPAPGAVVVTCGWGRPTSSGYLQPTNLSVSEDIPGFELYRRTRGGVRVTKVRTDGSVNLHDREFRINGEPPVRLNQRGFRGTLFEHRA